MVARAISIYTTLALTLGCGCQHDCKYCYAKSILSFRNLWNEKQPSIADIHKIEKTIANDDIVSRSLVLEKIRTADRKKQDEKVKAVEPQVSTEKSSNILNDYRSNKANCSCAKEMISQELTKYIELKCQDDFKDCIRQSIHTFLVDSAIKQRKTLIKSRFFHITDDCFFLNNSYFFFTISKLLWFFHFYFRLFCILRIFIKGIETVKILFHIHTKH